jgi:uncharacterized protein
VRRDPAIIDTNVLVTGLITKDDASPAARLLDGMLAGKFSFVVSQALLAEYRTVLLRPKIRRSHGLNVSEIESILTDIAQAAIVQAPVTTRPAPDPGDQLLWELLAAKNDAMLVTGDKQLLEDATMKGRVISPRDFPEMRLTR